MEKDLQEKINQIKHTLTCPYCNEHLTKWEMPDSPFNDWDVDYLYVCFNEKCPYYVRGWENLRKQGALGFSYRLVYDPKRDNVKPMAVPAINKKSTSIDDQAKSIGAATRIFSKWPG